MNDVIRYSEAFKLQVVRELEEGKLKSVNAAQEAYGIRGSMTVGKWGCMARATCYERSCAWRPPKRRASPRKG